MKKRVLIIDNYDSFTHTIALYLKELNCKITIIYNDEFQKAKELKKFDFSHLIISPGPNSPKQVAGSLKAIKYFKKTKKILGICLGHQCIAEVFGGKVAQLHNPTHGKISTLHFKKEKFFRGVKKKPQICLYHSLYVAKMPKNCKVLAKSDEKVIMALRHKKYNIFGIQFHPESVLTQEGKKILANFIRL
ncbi:aminodeoxychorismate/anthranilate synthase component II [Campylobacter sp. MIT 21-1685]|uniref:anthranilate synthase component II n=1 Tax=unclassified Campylobacter TaxID=2593542 RepID=UPI00224B46EB|nr:MULTISPECIES: aminodeoxychorismate/anthranilate synthase component II [unclassified Campylobacter]MCX2682962.1 aminodeoxychorismate/anthranilate synthase component II [Campylobacter sp. MIT 21-1684]MCX2751244.1 aminodeoxychorismate/anthranilate synthase component II [Campylobacter sp. MIT 21-1682]MCX2807443.1 aminodeoxychorismate/anthranilate synthase component II [Campylobacter sp. MIT 21-1685]